MNKFKNGYKDGSGKGTIILKNESILRTHWGCSCCDPGADAKAIKRADEIVKFLNKNGFKFSKEAI